MLFSSLKINLLIIFCVVAFFGPDINFIDPNFAENNIFVRNFVVPYRNWFLIVIYLALTYMLTNFRTNQ